jgi:hypothetical protein
MYKKRFIVFVVLVIFALIAAGGLFAQEGGSSVKNWISGDLSLLGAGVRYERILNDNFSIGGTVFFHSFFLFWNSIGVNVTGRWYPWAENFYAELGIGYGTINGTEDYTSNGKTYSWSYTVNGVMITPGVGLRIDVGSPGGFFINPMVSLPIVLGSKKNWVGESEFRSGVNFRPAFGMGYAF